MFAEQASFIDCWKIDLLKILHFNPALVALPSVSISFELIAAAVSHHQNAALQLKTQEDVIRYIFKSFQVFFFANLLIKNYLDCA